MPKKTLNKKSDHRPLPAEKSKLFKLYSMFLIAQNLKAEVSNDMICDEFYPHKKMKYRKGAYAGAMISHLNTRLVEAGKNHKIVAGRLRGHFVLSN